MMLWAWTVGSGACVLASCQEENSQVDWGKLCLDSCQKSANVLKGQLATWGLREVGLNKPDLVVMLCQALFPVYILLQKKIILTPCFKTKIFIISHSFCGSGTGAQPSWVLPAQGLLCSYGESLLAGAGIGSRWGLASTSFFSASQGFSAGSLHMH